MPPYTKECPWSTVGNYTAASYLGGSPTTTCLICSALLHQINMNSVNDEELGDSDNDGKEDKRDHYEEEN